MRKFHEAILAGRLIPLAGRDKFAALRELSEALGKLCETTPQSAAAAPDALLSELLRREAECATGVGCGLAIPHIRRPAGGEIRCVAGWSCDGLDFAAADSEPVRLVAAYVVPDESKNEYLREISGLIRTTFKPHSGEKLSALSACSTPAAARAFLLDWLGPQP